ncbi:MAG: hypothetical protein GY834_12920 [Bacteroidetes bacterium]|nr:hypothetical protein [Bacteroidota bacterium]
MRYIIITILFFLLTGCVSSRIDSNAERSAQTHMVLAESKEKSLNYQEAIKEYAAIFKSYPNTSSKKKAALKATRLNIHPNNSKIDYIAALYWLQVYSNLQLTPEEEENALILAVLIRQINLIQDEKGKLASQIKNQKKEKAILLKTLTAYEAELVSLEKKSSILKEKLQKIKEVDVQMQKSRKSSTSSPLVAE